MADLAERGAIGVRKLQPSFQLSPQDAIFDSQIFVPRQQFLVYCACHIGQDARKLHEFPLPLFPANPR